MGIWLKIAVDAIQDISCALQGLPLFLMGQNIKMELALRPTFWGSFATLHRS